MHRRTAAGQICAAALLGAAAPSTGVAQTSTEPLSRDARIAALELHLHELEAELAALEAVSPVPTRPPASVTPSSAGTARAIDAPSIDAAADLARGPMIAEGTPTSAATASIIGGRPTIQSADARFTANLLAVMQFDAAAYQQVAAGPLAVDLRRGAASTDTAHARDLSSGSDFRRARLGLGGKLFGDFEYTALFEFGGAGEEDAGHIQELWVQYSGIAPFHARAGAFAPFIGLEDAGSTNAMPFLERPTSSDIARSLAGGDYREGGQIVANGERWFASGAVTGRLVGVVNSTATGVTQPYDSQLGWVGRAAVIPMEGEDYLVHLGVHASYVEHPADTGGPDAASTTARYPLELRERPELRVDGTRLIDTGAIDAVHAHMLGAEFAASWRNLFLQSEYDDVGVERRHSTLSNPDFPGWYAEASWMLTGERRRYNHGNFAFDGPPVRRVFDPKAGAWGAFELAFRYSDEDLNYHAGRPGAAAPVDGIRGGDQTILTTALDWYLNPVVRMMFEWQHVDVERLSPNATTFQTPVGAQIGQHYEAYAMRSSLAF